MLSTVTRESTRSLLIANAVTLAMALVFEWPLSLLLWPYWIQSVVIGFFSGKRMLALERFSTEDVLVNDHPVGPTEATKHSAVLFFALHYGFFITTRAEELGRWDWIGIAVAALSFVWNHRFSYRHTQHRDAGVPAVPARHTDALHRAQIAATAGLNCQLLPRALLAGWPGWRDGER